MDKYWMLYRTSKRRDLGEDFSSRKPPVETTAVVPEPKPNASKQLIALLRSRIKQITRPSLSPKKSKVHQVQ
ncbi:MAG: hypothetical protein AAF614_08280 [Chloroflexota bacterium]